MANHKSAIKRHRQSEKRRAANRSNLRRLRSQMKKIGLALSSKNTDEVKKLLSLRMLPPGTNRVLCTKCMDF